MILDVWYMYTDSVCRHTVQISPRMTLVMVYIVHTECLVWWSRASEFAGLGRSSGGRERRRSICCARDLHYLLAQKMMRDSLSRSNRCSVNMAGLRLFVCFTVWQAPAPNIYATTP